MFSRSESSTNNILVLRRRHINTEMYNIPQGLRAGGESNANNILVLEGPHTDIEMYKIAQGWKACLANTILPTIIPIEKYCNIEYDDRNFLLILTPNIFSEERANIPRTLLEFIKPIQLNAVIVLLSLSNYDVDYEPLTKHFLSGLRKLPVLAIVLHGEETPEDIKQFQDKVKKTNLGKYITEMYEINTNTFYDLNNSIGNNLEVSKEISKKIFNSISNKNKIYEICYLSYRRFIAPSFESSDRIMYLAKIRSFRTDAIGCLDPKCREPQNLGKSIVIYNPGVCHKFCKDNSADIKNCHIFQKDKCTICLDDITSHTKYFYKIDRKKIKSTAELAEQKTEIISVIATLLLFKARVFNDVNRIDTTTKTGREVAEEMSKIIRDVTSTSIENVYSAIEKLYLMRSDFVKEDLILSLIQKTFSTTNSRLEMFEVPITRSDFVKISDTLGSLKRKLDSFANSEMLDQLEEVIGTIKKLREDAVQFLG